jgi:hypothetical protein
MPIYWRSYDDIVPLPDYENVCGADHTRLPGPEPVESEPEDLYGLDQQRFYGNEHFGDYSDDE